MLNWVDERRGCSSKHIWEKIRGTIENDIQRWRAGNQAQEAVYDEFHLDMILVERRPSHAMKIWCRIERTATGFTITQGAGESANGTTTSVSILLNDNGRCRLIINGQERRLWQVSRFALEPVLFPSA